MRQLAIASIALLVFSGCVQEEPASPAAGSSAYTSASVSDETGGLEGIIIDDELRPIEGAEVSLTPGSSGTTTDPEGRFSFSGLATGSYVLAAARLGYESVARKVDVEVGKLSQVNVTLVAIEIAEAYVDLRILDGFIKYGTATSDIATTGNQYGCEKCRFNFTYDGSDVEAAIIEPFFKPAAPQPPTDPMRLGFQGGFQSELCVGDAVFSIPPDNDGYWTSRQKVVAPESCKFNAKKGTFYMIAYCDWDWICMEQKFQLYVSLFHASTPADAYTGLPPE